MGFRVHTQDGYIISIEHTANGGNITAEDYARIERAIAARPTVSEGCIYRLREDLTWECCERPAPSDDQE